MKKHAWGLVLVSSLMLALAASLSAQTIQLKASIPFEFVSGTTTMPAGEYMISSPGSAAIISIRSVEEGSVAYVMSFNVSSNANMDRDKAELVFNRHGDQYFLSRVWDGSQSAGRAIPKSRTERELSARGRPEAVILLAHR